MRTLVAVLFVVSGCDRLAEKAVVGTAKGVASFAGDDEEGRRADEATARQANGAAMGPARALTDEASAAARAGNCARVAELDVEAAKLPPSIHANVFLGDPDVRGCVEMQRSYGAAVAARSARRHVEAAIQFRAAYAARPEPRLLYDIASSYKLAGLCREAHVHYRRYLLEAPPDVNVTAAVRAEIDACTVAPP